MANSALTTWSRHAGHFPPAVFLPGEWGERLATDGVVVGAPSPSQTVVVTHVNAVHECLGMQAWMLSRSVGLEAAAVSDLFFYGLTSGSMKDSNLFYDGVSSEDRFDYVSVPIQPSYTVRAKLNWVGRAKPMPVPVDE
jgi:hypothetical protein